LKKFEKVAPIYIPTPPKIRVSAKKTLLEKLEWYPYTPKMRPWTKVCKMNCYAVNVQSEVQKSILVQIGFKLSDKRAYFVVEAKKDLKWRARFERLLKMVFEGAEGYPKGGECSFRQVTETEAERLLEGDPNWYEENTGV